MAEKEKKDTEQQIFEAACRIFKRYGYGGARMQEIADEANVNISMLHYYYRSKDQLFEKVYQQQMEQFLPATFELWNVDLPLDEKIKKIIDNWYSFYKANPRIIQFWIREMNENPQRFSKFRKTLHIEPHQIFDRQIKEEIEQGNITNVDPHQLSVSIAALTLFPLIVKPLEKSLHNWDDQQCEQFLEERKDFLVDFILNGINYKKNDE
jgi:AcrR family transcriptional regulator